VEITEIGEEDLAQLVAVRNAVWPHDPETVEGYLDWRRQADAMLWLLARRNGEPVGAGVGIVGWHSPPGVGRATVVVLPASRGMGVGTELGGRIASWLHEHGCAEATGGVSETDDASMAWAARRGFVEVGRSSILTLDLSGVEAPAVAPPEGVAIVTFADRPDLARALYDIYREAVHDIPGEADARLEPFDDWLANDMQGAGDRPDATFIAVAAGKVVGYAKLSMLVSEGDVAWHDLTAVRRGARGRGIAGCLKRVEIAWAKQNGFRYLRTFNEERNEPIRRLNERHGYRLEPGFVSVRGTLTDERSVP
jgi:GNAT superfamily N-acetyltransferase